MNKVRGFTLIEILIVVVIVAISATIALTSYQTYTIRANRIDMQQTMHSISQQMQAYKAGNNFSYTNATFASATSVSLVNATAAIGSQYPASNPRYNLTLSVPDQTTDPAGSSWRLTASPVSPGTQNGNGDLVINDQGWTCWNNPSGTAVNLCTGATAGGAGGTPSQTTTWSGN